MGCCSSKTTSEEQLKDNEKSKNDPKMAKADDDDRKKRSGKTELWKTKSERCRTDDDFADVVMEALRANFDLITVDDFKDYIASRYTCEADESYQNEIIHKVIGEQFVKGCMAIKSI